MAKEGSAEATIREIKRKTRRKYSAEEKIRIVVEGLRGAAGRLHRGPQRLVDHGQDPQIKWNPWWSFHKILRFVYYGEAVVLRYGSLILPAAACFTRSGLRS